MSTLTIEIEDEAKAIVERLASELNLSPADFVRVAIAQSLARSLKDPFLEERAAHADGSGFRDFLAGTPIHHLCRAMSCPSSFLLSLFPPNQAWTV